MKDETPLSGFDTIDLNHYNTFWAWKDDNECVNILEIFTT